MKASPDFVIAQNDEVYRKTQSFETWSACYQCPITVSSLLFQSPIEFRVNICIFTVQSLRLPSPGTQTNGLLENLGVLISEVAGAFFKICLYNILVHVCFVYVYKRHQTTTLAHVLIDPAILAIIRLRGPFTWIMVNLLRILYKTDCNKL